MRTRVFRNTNLSLPKGNEWYRDDNMGNPKGTPFISGDVPGGYYIDTLVVTDDPHPGFHKAIANGDLVIGNMTLREEKSSAGGGSFMYSGPYNGKAYNDGGSVTLYYKRAASTIYYPSLAVQSVKDLTDQAIMSAVSNIDKTPYSFMEDFLTLRQNLDMIKEPLAGLDKWSKMVRQAADKRVGTRHPKTGKRVSFFEAISDSYLAYRFGATPFVHSLADLLEGIATSNQGVNANVRYRAGSQKESSAATSNVIGTNRANQTFKYARSLHRKVVVGIFYKLRHPQKGLRWKYGLRNKDIPAGLWAAMPYSFMIDRIIDVSKYAKAVSNLADPNVMIEGGYITVYEEDESSLRALTEPLWSGWTASVNADEEKKFVRTINRSFFYPHIPDLRPAVSYKGLVSDATKITDLVTLILQRFRR